MSVCRPLLLHAHRMSVEKSNPSRLSQCLMIRCFGTGSRGARGHGWYVQYRRGDGGRHLQQPHLQEEDEGSKRRWNQSILQLGRPQSVYMDVSLQAPATTNNNNDDTTTTATTPPSHRLYLHLASHVMPESTQNFGNLLQDYIGTKFYRLERNVGWCGGDMLTNTGKSGRAASSRRLSVTSDPLVLWHIPGTVSMLVPKVGEIDSRFMFCTHMASHMDGIHQAIGMIQPESLVLLQQWERSVLTRNGVPMTDLVITDCGVATEEGGQEAVAS